MELETVNKLYLELSQVATATTVKELALRAEVAALTKERGIARHNEQCTHEANRRILKELLASQARLEEARSEIERLKREN